MTNKGLLSVFVLIVGGLLLSSCLLPGMLPLDAEPAEPRGPMPTMETDSEAVIEALRGGEFVYLQALAEEQYTQEDYARPGRLTFTVNITDPDQPTYFHYGWCTTTEEILEQNFEHIRVGLYFEGQALEDDVVHAVTSTRQDGMVCLEFGALMSDWAPGDYTLEAIATFDEEINDGLEDFEAGEYIYEYNVTVSE
jgi:hypothetical protein